MERRQFLKAAMAVASGMRLRSQPKSPRRTVRVAVTPYPTMSSFYVAHEMGYFSDAGLDIQTEQINSSFQVAPLLATGRMDVSFASPTPAFINAVARGGRIRIVAAREVASPSCGDTGRIYGRRDSFPNGLTDLSVLKGKRLAMRNRASINEFVADMLLRYARLRREDLKIVPLERDEELAAILGGRIDALIAGAQFDNAFAALSSQLVRGIGLAQVCANFQYSHIFFGKNLLDGAPDMGARFLRAYFHGASDFLKGRTPRFLEEYARSNNLDFKQLRGACRNTVVPEGSIDFESLPKFVAWAIEKGYCEASANSLELTDTRFLSRSRA